MPEIRGLLEAGETDNALVLLDEYKQVNPADFTAYLYAGWALILEGRNRDAEVELRQAIELQPGTAAEAEMLARLVADLGFPALALESLEAASKHYQLSSEGLFKLAELQFSQRRFEKALTTLDLLGIKDLDRQEEVSLLRGQTYLQKGQLEKAMSAFEKVVWADQESAEGFHGLAETAYRGNNLPAARKMAERAIEKDPDNPLYLHLLGTIARSQGDYSQALTYLIRASRLEGAPIQVFFDIGETYRRMGESAKARVALTEYQQKFTEQEKLANDKQRVLQLVNQGKQHIEAGQIGEAVRSLRRTVTIDPDHWEARQLLAKIYLSSNRLSLTKEQIDELLRIDPESTESQYLAALYWQQTGELQKALTYALKGRALRPSHPDLRNLLGNLYYALGEKARALAEYEAAAKLAPDRPEFQANYQALKPD